MLDIWFLMMISFFITFLLLTIVIDIQHQKKLGQIEREEGLDSHKEKKNTPIFGGLAFLFSFIILFTYLLIKSHIDYFTYLLIVFPMISFSLIGLIDDILIIKKRNNTGMNSNVKFFFQILISLVYFVIYLLFKFDTMIDFIFFTIDLKFLYGILILLLFSGFTNASNLTDGIDGLLGGIFSLILLGFYFVSNTYEMKMIISILFSGMCAFLYFNLPKAKIFMGNIGSLCIGSLFVSLGIMMKKEIFLFIFGLIFIIEAFSVIIQVAYFKISKGKRIFKMAPIHHHFEIVFNSEVKTLLLFYVFVIVTVIFGVLLFNI